MFFLFALAGFGTETVLQSERLSGAAKILTKVWLVLLAVGFVLLLAVTFSIPLPKGFMDMLF